MSDYGRGGEFFADCPARFAIELLADKWTVPVLSALSLGPRRPRDLLESIGGISGKVLSRTLRQLESRGFVQHQRHAEAPPRVDYSLTSLGVTLTEPVLALSDWVRAHGDAVRDASGAEPQGSL
ncbi:winged helix-turn-helix transcriptional regulator [Amnibacterium setariae]|uniref:Transcriptional regulator n=1 Tax=Amnibacterium setariae TaxID=2306585 RepID=A0A3A1TZ77_9MICO|nr:helix-turn-helix domain-containing protein [Amnibacterium setariae]RIX29954.1 transcriptional regulator [Amnibacterium setariae]